MVGYCPERSHTVRGISGLVEDLLVSQEGLCVMELVSESVNLLISSLDIII